jgi:hypothetical protein
MPPQTQTIAAVMQANAEHAVRYARDRYRWELDFTPASIDRVDKIIDVLHVELPKSFLARALKRSAIDEEVWTMAKMWGGYAGETFRRAWGGRWRTMPRPDGGKADIILELPAARCEVVERVRWRLAEGAGERLTAIYADLRRQHQAAAPNTGGTP